MAPPFSLVTPPIYNNAVYATSRIDSRAAASGMWIDGTNTSPADVYHNIVVGMDGIDIQAAARKLRMHSNNDYLHVGAGVTGKRIGTDTYTAATIAPVRE